MNALLQKNAGELGVVRLIVCSVFLAQMMTCKLSDVGYLPTTLMHPPGVMEYLSWRFYDRVVTPGGLQAVAVATSCALAAAAIGYCTKFTLPLATALVIFTQGILRSFGHYNHDEMVGIYCLIILPCSPCADGAAIDALARPKTRASWIYGYPILLMQLVMAWSYFSAGLLKLRLGGLAYFSQDHLPVVAIQHSLDNLHDTNFKLAFLLPAVRELTPWASALAVAWEILFPAAVFFRRLTPWFLGVGVLFHLSTMALLNITFPTQCALYLIFVNWKWAGSWFAKFGSIGRAVAGWRTFAGFTEVFDPADARVASHANTLLWDGACGFCQRAVERLQWFARAPFKATPFQNASELPASIVAASKRQMHWVGRDGSVVGGSEALIAVLAQSGHPLLAGVLGSQMLRPFT